MIHASLRRIAQLRRESPALQRGLQLDLRLEGDEAAFYRVYQHDGVAQTALVLLNKGDAARRMVLDTLVQSGEWRDAFDGSTLRLDGRLELEVQAHGVRVLLRDAPLDDAALLERLQARMRPAQDGVGKG
jgi:cyclomaltodextrin glucanotransferase